MLKQNEGNNAAGKPVFRFLRRMLPVIGQIGNWSSDYMVKIEMLI